MRRLVTITVLLGVLALLVGVAPATAGAVEGRPTADPGGKLHIVKVSGLLDPVLADFVARSIDQAERDHAVGVVLQLNSSDAVVSDRRLADLAERMHDATIPVSIWVGPSGSKAKGKVAQLLGVASHVAVAPGSSIGDTGDVVVDRSLLRPAFRAQLGRLHDATMGYQSARSTGVATNDGPVLGEFIVGLPGVKTKTLETPEGPRRQPVTSPVFSQLPVQTQIFHTVASPSVAYLLFLIGMVLIVLELYTAGVGVAGLVGAGCFVLGCYGFGVLPVTGWGVGLLVFAVLAYAIDVQTGVPRVWTGIGTAALIVGSVMLYDGLSISWLTLIVGVAGTALFMIFGLPALVRSRFSTPSVDREWMVGLDGETVERLGPDGTIRVDGALWPARAAEGELGAGTAVTVRGVEGLLLLVGPDGASGHDPDE
ncbi:MAG TPA: NfeD family protein [Acidimicrobiales bacterium]|nr:NfeD family protein [Acidimicrobiales bacterium]